MAAVDMVAETATAVDATGNTAAIPEKTPQKRGFLIAASIYLSSFPIGNKERYIAAIHPCFISKFSTSQSSKGKSGHNRVYGAQSRKSL